MLLGILVLAGWFFHLSALKRVALGSSPMVANAAVAFVLDGLALVLIARRRPRAAWIGAAISLLAGILTLVEYGLSCDLGFDRWLIAVTLSGAAAPGRLAPNTAVAFVFCGLALSCAARRSFFRGRQALVGVLGSIVMGMGTASAFGYLIDYPVCSWGSWTPMAAGTAVGCMALGLGVILVATLDGRLHTEAPEHWPAVAAGSAGATITLSFAQALHTVLHAHFGPVSDAGVRLGRNAAASPEVLLGWSYHGVILSVVAVGITISVLIALLVGLALGARRRAKAIQKVNEKLENEIRERKQVEQQLLGSEERFRGAFEQAPYGMCLSAIDGHLLLVNRTFCQLVGRSEPELLAGGWQELTHPEDLDLSRAQLEQLLGGQVPCLEFEKRYLDRERNVIWAQVNTSLLRDREGAPSHFVTHVADISARRRAEIDLRNREERFRAAFEYAPFGIASSARDRRMNSTLCRMVGYSEAELLARNWDEITHADDRAVSPEAIARLEREGPEWVEFEKRYLHKQGRAVWARVRLSRAPDSSEGWHLVTHIEDVTERKRVEEASRTNEERVRQLLDSTAEAIYGLDMDGNCTFANAACLEMLGYAGVGALIGKNMHALAHHTRADGSAYPVAQCRIYKALLRNL